jgi:hypothetical protein
MDLTTRATLTRTVVTDVLLRGGKPLQLTEARLQFGANCNTNPVHIRLWTHTDTVLANDLASMGMAALAAECSDRSTRNIVADNLPLEEFVRHEMSPNARLLHLRHKNLPEMWSQLLARLDDPLGASAAGHPYVRRTEIVVVHQTAAHFIDEVALAALPAGVVVLFTVADGGTGLGADTVRMVAASGRGTYRGAYWVEELGAWGRISMATLFRHLLHNLPEAFQSCQAPQENLVLHADSGGGDGGDGGATPCFLINDNNCVPMATFLGLAGAALKPIAPCASLFTPYWACAMGGSVNMHYSVTRGLATTVGEFVESAAEGVRTTTAAELLEASPGLALPLARLLLYEAASLQPTGSVVHALTPYDALRRQAAALKGNEVLERAAAVLLDAPGAAEWRSPAAAAAICAMYASTRQLQKAFADSTATAAGLLLQTLHLLERVGEWCLPPRMPLSGSSVLQALYVNPLRETLAQPLVGHLEGSYIFPPALPSRQVSQSASYTGT